MQALKDRLNPVKHPKSYLLNRLKALKHAIDRVKDRISLLKHAAAGVKTGCPMFLSVHAIMKLQNPK